MWATFWDAERQHFRTLKKSSETVDSWNGYVVWPFIIGVEALLEAEVASPGNFTAEISASLEAVEKFYSNEYGAYTAWLAFTGNHDIYYDDNAQVAIALLRAYNTSSVSKAVYLTRAKRIVDFLFTGWDSANGGGMKWHVEKTVRNAISTSLAAVAVLGLVKTSRQISGTASGGVAVGVADKTEAELIAFARQCVQWVLDELQLDSGLIMDGVGGGPTYTYNTGVPLHAICLLQELNPTSDLAAKAEKLAAAAVDKTKSLFDLTVANLEYRFWWDNTYFLQLLIKGLISYAKTYAAIQPAIAQRVIEEMDRQLRYVKTYIIDSSDGLYWRSLRLYAISQEKLAIYRQLTGDNRGPEYDQEERLMDDTNLALPVAERELCKTLLGNGGAARTFLLAGQYFAAS
ncbi:glycosyl hydrolase family 76-domain-containing protein [Tuber borchii]|uniref:Glycosyl hydrolase family 76-domain-containing protein n=1 Tax=Tuber borchii TaxID=42251 RepID=A0A2T7A0E2_TUBBO|nr:glycosyl hydrolase family 76-domain-containing protein [Tuber borchii]